MKLTPGTPLTVDVEFAPSEKIRVGRLAVDRGRAVLEYDAELIARGITINPFFAPPSGDLEWAKELQLFDGLHGIFAGSLPDAWGDLLMRRRAERANVDYAALSVLDRLAIVGSRGMGALIYQPAIAPQAIDAIDLDLFAREALSVIEGKDGELLPQLERLGGSSTDTAHYNGPRSRILRDAAI